MAVALKSYKVGIGRGRSGPTRWMTLELDEPRDGVGAISLFFGEGRTQERGFVNRQTGHLVVNLPVSDFEALYHLVQTERPVYAHWRIDSSNDGLVSIDLSTSAEPVGEGFSDPS